MASSNFRISSNGPDMASSTFREMEENFFLCSVCLDHFKEPKLLPCLHRYCRDCVKTVIKASQGNKFQCPLCNEHCSVPKEGVDGFKTDFHMKSMLEFIQSQNSPESNEGQTKKCTCSNAVTVLRCCTTCENIPVCETCANVTHQGHDLHDVSTLSRIEKESLRQILSELENHKDHLKDLRERCKAHDVELKNAAAMKKEKLQHQYHEHVQQIEGKIDNCNVTRERELSDVESDRQSAKYRLDTEMEEEINLVRKKYEELKKTTDNKFDRFSMEVSLKYDKIGGALYKTLARLDSTLLNMNTTVDALTRQKEEEIKVISDHYEQVHKRYENFRATASSIFASNDEWTAVQCVPDITSASNSLMDDMKKEFPDLDWSDLSSLRISVTPTVSVGEVIATTNYHRSVVDVEGMKTKAWSITGLAGNSNGSITVTGRASANSSHITVINKNGAIQRQDQIGKQSEFETLIPHRYCCFLSTFKLVTVCRTDEIGIYDIRDGSYNSTNISDVIGSWPDGLCVTCVTTDPVHSHIIVGTNKRKVFVFDEQLKYSHTMTLPDEISEVIDLAVHSEGLLICDTIGKRSHLVTMEEMQSTLKYELPKPEHSEGNWRPTSVCRDEKGFIYILWKAFASSQSRCLLLEYSQDGRRLLTETTVNGDARSVRTLMADDKEKLLISTYKSGQLYIADLVETTIKIQTAE